MPRRIGIAFCGAGGIVKSNHLPAVEARPERYEVAGFFDVAPDKAAGLAGDTYRAYTDYDELLADGGVDMVVVATKPLETHFPAALQALEAGKHVLLEKPMASTAEACDDLLRVAREKQLTLTVHHNRRLDLDFLALRDVIQQSVLGDLRLVENCVGSGGYGGGDFVDWGVHLADQCLLLNSSPLREVSAMFCNPAGGRDDAGFGEATLRFDEPPLVRLAMLPRTTEFLRNGTPADARFYAVGTSGAFSQRVIENQRDLMNATQAFDQLRPRYAVPDYLDVRRDEYYDYLYESLAEGKPLLVRPEEARNAIRLLELMEESATQNRTIEATAMLET